MGGEAAAADDDDGGEDEDDGAAFGTFAGTPSITRRNVFASTDGTGRWLRVKRSSWGVRYASARTSGGVSPLYGRRDRATRAGWRAGSAAYGSPAAAASWAMADASVGSRVPMR
jgi:hypothetical protein